MKPLVIALLMLPMAHVPADAQATGGSGHSGGEGYLGS